MMMTIMGTATAALRCPFEEMLWRGEKREKKRERRKNNIKKSEITFFLSFFNGARRARSGSLSLSLFLTFLI